jgi:predicted nucleic acid-binding protein
VTRRPLILLAACAALAACGGGDDKGDAEQTVRDFVDATNERDADRFCCDLVTQEFLEQSTGAKGDKAEDACRDQLKAVRGLKLKLVEIERTKVDGDRATVRVRLETQGTTQKQVLRLRKEDGDWKLAGGSGE